MIAEYEFSFTAVIIGLIIVALGALMVRYYNKLSDTIPIGNYTRWRLAGFITIGIGFLVITNLPSFILAKIVEAIISGGL